VEKKFVELNEVKKTTLREGMKNHQAHLFRGRCHCLLLSAEGYEVKDLAAVFPVSQMTIYNWLRRWERGGISGLKDSAGRGRKPILQAVDLPQVKARVQENARQLKIARQRLKEELGREFSEKTLRRFLKSLVADTRDGANV
jgi:transposase